MATKFMAVLALGLTVIGGVAYAKTCYTNCYWVGNSQYCNTNCY